MKMKTYLNRWILTTGMFCTSMAAFAQSLPAFEQYHFNQFVLNPAYAGSKNTFETNFFLHRQDVKIDGGPSTESFTFHAPVANQKLGIGFKFYHDQIGVTEKISFGFDAAYKMYLGEGALSAGLELSMSNYQFNYSTLDAFETGDPTFTGEPVNVITPNAGIGVYYNNDIFYLGASVINIAEDKDNTGEDGSSSALEITEQTRHYFIHSGVLIKATDNLSLKPHALMKYAYGGPMQMDLNMDLIFYNTFWTGVAIKTNKSMSLMAQYVLDYDKTLSANEFSFGYAYNFLLDDRQTYFGPTHEIFFAYRFDKHNTKIRSPRFF